MDAIEERRFEIRSHNEEALKKIRLYFEKYPKLPDTPPKEESQIEKELRAELKYLKRVLNK